MKIDKLKGSIVAIVTPFTKNREVDFNTFDQLIDWHIAEGTDGIVVCGTTGETPTLSEEEDAMLIERAIKRVKGRIPVIAGTGSNSTNDCIRYSATAKDKGADALLIVAPYYNKPTNKGMYEHYSLVAEEVNLPIILYNVPGRTGSNISADLAIKLAKDHENIVAIKEAGGSMAVFAELLANRPEGFKIYSGDDFLATAANLLGADGCISVVANVIPKAFHDLMEASLKGNTALSQNLFFKFKKLMDYMFIESNPLPVKTALAMMGKINETFRLPLSSMEGDKRKILEDEMIKLNLI